jgi:hypothetical protein
VRIVCRIKKGLYTSDPSRCKRPARVDGRGCWFCLIEVAAPARERGKIPAGTFSRPSQALTVD